jgi:predicted DNA-binding protein
MRGFVEKSDDVPIIKTLPIRFPISLHERAKSAAKKKGQGITQFVLFAIRKAIQEVENG